MSNPPSAACAKRALLAASVVVTASTGAAGLVVGCSSSSDDPSSFSDASAARPNGDAASALDGSTIAPEDDASAGPTFATSVRFAHLAPGLGSVDFCWRASATDPFDGPLLGGGPTTTTFDAGLSGGDASAGADAGAQVDAALEPADGGPSDAGAMGGIDGSTGDGGYGGGEGDAGPSPLSYLTVSPTLKLTTTGKLDVIAVEPGTSCAAPLVLAHLTLPATSRTTFLLAGGAQGDASGGLGIVALGDEVSASDATRASVRVVNAALVPATGSFTASLVQTTNDITLASVVAPGSAASPSAKDAGTPAVDALGYTLIEPTGVAPVFRIVFADADAGSDAGVWSSKLLPEALDADEVTTAFVGHDAQGYLVLWSSDTDTALVPSWFVSR